MGPFKRTGCLCWIPPTDQAPAVHVEDAAASDGAAPTLFAVPFPPPHMLTDASTCASKHAWLMLTKPRPPTAHASVGEIGKAPFRWPPTGLVIDDFQPHSVNFSIRRMMCVFRRRKPVPVTAKWFLNAEMVLLAYIISIYSLFLRLLAAHTVSLKANVTLKLSSKVSSL